MNTRHTIRTVSIIGSILLLFTTTAYGQLRADQVNGVDAFDQINKTIAILYGSTSPTVSNQGIVDATNLKGISTTAIMTELVVQQSNLQIRLGAATYTQAAPPNVTMITIGTGSSGIPLSNVDIEGQGDRATFIQCSTITNPQNAPCITITSGSHIHIHDLTIMGTTSTTDPFNSIQDCILIQPGIFPKIDSVEIDHIHFVNCGHANISGWGVTNLRIHDNTFEGSGWAGIALPIVEPCLPSIVHNNTAYTQIGNLITITTSSTVANAPYPVVGDYVYISSTGTTLTGVFKIVNVVTATGTSESYQIVTQDTPPSGGAGLTQYLTCDNGIWIDQNVMNDYGVIVNQAKGVGTVGGISITYDTDGYGGSNPVTLGNVTGYTNVHIRRNIIKCQSNNVTSLLDQNNKLILRLNALADSEVSENDLIACGAGAVSGENVATVAYHLGIENNDLWNSESNATCLLITQQTIVNPAIDSYFSCPNQSCGSQGYAVHGNRFHNCALSNFYFTANQKNAIFSDIDISNNIGDDSGTANSTYGLAFTNEGDGCKDKTIFLNGCPVTIARVSVHDNDWGGLPGKASGNGVNVVIGPEFPLGNATINYSSIITGAIDFWGNNSASSNAISSQETGFLRRNLKDIYCATDQPTTPDMTCSQPPDLQNSDYGGTGALFPALAFTHMYTGTYVTAPVCTANDTTHLARLDVQSTLTQVTINGGMGAMIGDMILYTCNPIVSHN